MQSRKLVYYVAASIDNFIAHEDESVDGFLVESGQIADYLNSLNEYDTVLMGKKTYEWGYQFGVQPGQPASTYAHMMQYVFSQTMPAYQHEQLQVIREDAATFVRQLKQQPGKSIYLCGGGLLAGTLLDNELIDELYLKLHPVAFGSGIPLFGSSQKAFALTLNHIRTYTNGVIYINYAVRHP